MNTSASVGQNQVAIDPTSIEAANHQAINGYWQKLYNNRNQNYIYTFYQDHTSILNLIFALFTIVSVSIFLFSIVFALLLLPLITDPSALSNIIPGLVLFGKVSPVKRISYAGNFLSSVSPFGLTIWNTENLDNFTHVNTDELEYVEHFNLTMLATLSKNANLSYWKSTGILTRSTTIAKIAYTSMLTTKSGQIILSSKDATLDVFNSEQKIIKSLKTSSPIVDMVILVDENLATVDQSKQIRIYNSKSFDLIKNLDRSRDQGRISMLSTCYLDNIEHIMYTIGPSLYLFDYINEHLVRTINMPGNIIKAKYIRKGLAAIAVDQDLFYYDLLSGLKIENITIYRTIQALTSNSTHTFIGTGTGEITILNSPSSFVSARVNNENNTKTYIAMNNGNIFVLNPQGKIERSLITRVKVVSLAFLSDQSLVTLDSNNHFKIWQSRTLRLNKTISAMNHTGSIEHMDTGFISNAEYAFYSINSTLYAMNLKNGIVDIIIKAHGKINAFRCIEENYVALAVRNELFFYNLKNISIVKDVTLNADILRLNSFENFLDVTTIDGKISRIETKFFAAKKISIEPKKSVNLNPIKVVNGVIIPMPGGKILRVDKQTASIGFEKQIFDCEIVAFEKLNQFVICAISQDGHMVFINPNDGEIFKRFSFKKNVFDLEIESMAFVMNKFVLVKSEAKIVQVNIENGKADLFEIKKN